MSEIFVFIFTVVTGCKRGVGSAYVRELAACGLNVVLISRPYPRLMEFADKIGLFLYSVIQIIIRHCDISIL